MTATGEIRMIKWGLIPNLPGFQISVGQVVGGKAELTVTAILRENILAEKCEYHVVCVQKKKDDKDNPIPFIWKTYYKEPDEVQYFLPDEKHNYIKL